MDSRQRLLTTLAHQEPDRVPLDLGAAQVTRMRSRVYTSLRQRLGLPDRELTIYDRIQGLTAPDEDLVVHWGVDVGDRFPLNNRNWNVTGQIEGEHWVCHEGWCITHRRPTNGYAVMLKDPFVGIFDMLSEFKLDLWEMTLPQQADVISQADVPVENILAMYTLQEFGVY